MIGPISLSKIAEEEERLRSRMTLQTRYDRKGLTLKWGMKEWRLENLSAHQCEDVGTGGGAWKGSSVRSVRSSS